MSTCPFPNPEKYYYVLMPNSVGACFIRNGYGDFCVNRAPNYYEFWLPKETPLNGGEVTVFHLSD